MSRYIDADKLLESLRESYDSANEWYDEAEEAEIKIRAEQTIATFAECILRVKAQPAADVQEVKHGKWIEDGDVQICSECGEEHEWADYRAPYCDICGAKMDGKENEG